MPVSEKFTLLDLTDLALKFPEPGAVNFNVLHTVMTNLILKLGLEEVKVPCYVEDEVLAQTAVTKNRMKEKREKGVRKKSDEIGTQELKEKIQFYSVPEEKASIKELLTEVKDEYFFEEEPVKVMQEVWRATNINRRMEAAELGLTQLAELIDSMLDRILDLEESDVMQKLEEMNTVLDRMKNLEELCKLLGLRIDDSNNIRVSEVDRLDEILKELKIGQEEAKNAIVVMKEALDEKVAYKAELDDLKEKMSEDLKTTTKDLKRIIREVEESLVKKEEFEEFISRIEHLEKDKVSRDELGRLLEPGFIDSLLDEQLNLRLELDDLKEKVTALESGLEALKRMIEEEVIKVMEERFAEVQSAIDAINEKLALLDPDDINDSFANLEEQIEIIKNDLGELQAAFELLQKECKINFSKIANLSQLLNQLEQVKMDKTKLNELLEKKADLDLVMGKLDRSEFAIVVGNMKDDLNRLTIKVKMNEEEMNEGFENVRHELSLQMYKEDFIYCTEPIRNRIKALIYELKRVKEIALTHLFPDAPGIAKCISCNRGAHMASAKYAGDANTAFEDDIPQDSHLQIAYDKLSKPDTDSGEFSGISLPLTDLDNISFPPPDKPRERDPARLPILFATARPNIGLTHEKRRSTIDKELAVFFSKKPVRPIDAEYTRTKPQQRGTSFTTLKLSLPEREEVLLKGIDKSIYKGTVSMESVERKHEETLPQTIEPEKKRSDVKRPATRTSDTHLQPSVVSLHINNKPLKTPVTISKDNQRIMLPSIQIEKKHRN